jgi:hypothetical protein
MEVIEETAVRMLLAEITLVLRIYYSQFHLAQFSFI